MTLASGVDDIKIVTAIAYRWVI